RTERLLFEGRQPSVPHEDRAPRGIDDGRRMAAELRHAVADADRQAVAPAEARAMTARAGLRHGDREPRIEIKLLAERSLLRRVRIFLRERDRCRPLVLRLYRIDPRRSLRTEI